jgi:hypothetical protein
VAETLRAVLAFSATHVVDDELLLRTVELYEGHRLDFADAYLVASAERTGVREVASFDRAMDRVGTVRRVEPGYAFRSPRGRRLDPCAEPLSEPLSVLSLVSHASLGRRF